MALANPDDLEDGDETDVSLITGALRMTRFSSSEPVSSSHDSSLVLRNQALTVANANTAGTIYRKNKHKYLKTGKIHRIGTGSVGLGFKLYSGIARPLIKMLLSGNFS